MAFNINILPSTHYPMVDNGRKYAIYSMVNDDDDDIFKQSKKMKKRVKFAKI